jgi:hypothetical protein
MSAFDLIRDHRCDPWSKTENSVEYHGDVTMEIRPEDLFHKCTACAGTGKIAPPRESGQAEAATGGGTRCDRCDGRGLMLTDSGTVLRAFFQMLQDGKI